MPRSDSQSGSALLIVLAFIVILALVFVVFLSNSQRALRQSDSSASLLNTQLLGEVATAAVIEDLQAEMRAGADGNPAVDETMTVSQPWAMVPGRILKANGMLSNPDFANLVKQSVSGAAFFPGDNPATFSTAGRSRASVANSADPSENQRVISAERWSKPRLLGGPLGPANFSTGQLPDWILVTRDGAAESATTAGDVADRLESNADFVLGRFAYNVYRVDGLLDINAAGASPSNLGGGDASVKGSSAWADLRSLPGLETDSSVQALTDWRNRLTDTNYVNFIAGLSPSSAPNAEPGPWGEPGGFLEPYSDGSQTDNRFFSRQDLLAYFNHEFGDGANEQNALPYLTTFSADLDQPSYRPNPDRPTVERDSGDGGNDAFGSDDQINPAFLDVLDGSGEPMVRRRFPLNRLRFVEPNPSDATKVEEYFGLTWNAAENAWDYVDGAAVRRLSQISGREPNMIELLKAAIVAGSLGGQFEFSEVPGSPRRTGFRDGSVNFHVMRIAACIIDQYDADSYPTRIQFGTDVAFGVEDIPYLYGLRVTTYRQDIVPISAMSQPPPTPIPTFRSVVMIQPVLWNPHVPSTTPFSGPTNFRITASSAVDVQPVARRAWWTGSLTAYRSDWPVNTGGSVDPRDISEPIGFNPLEDRVTFSDSRDPGSKASFREPYTLKSPGYPAGSNSTAFDSTGEFFEPTLAADEQNDSQESDELDARTIGFRAGWSWSGPWEAGATSGNATWLQEGRVETNGINFELQYVSPSGGWVTYDSFEGFNNEYPYRLDRLNSGASRINPRFAQYYLRADPRVDRFGAGPPGRAG